MVADPMVGLVAPARIRTGPSRHHAPVVTSKAVATTNVQPPPPVSKLQAPIQQHLVLVKVSNPVLATSSSLSQMPMLKLVTQLRLRWTFLAPSRCTMRGQEVPTSLGQDPLAPTFTRRQRPVMLRRLKSPLGPAVHLHRTHHVEISSASRFSVRHHERWQCQCNDVAVTVIQR